MQDHSKSRERPMSVTIIKYQKRNWAARFKALAATALAVALAGQSSEAIAADCPSGWGMRNAYWSANPMISSAALNKTATTEQTWYNYTTKISVLIQTFKASDGTSGCVGNAVAQKNLPSAPMTYAPLPYSCSAAGYASATLVDNLQSKSTDTNSYTYTGRIPLSRQVGSQNTAENYDMQIILKAGKTISVCYAPVAANGVSEFWDGK